MKIIMVFTIMAMVFTISMAGANEYQCPPPPCPVCQPVQVTCQCDSGGTVLPGLWRGPVAGRTICGIVVTYSTGFIIYEGEDGNLGDSREGRTFFLSDTMKRLKQVESCD